MDDTNDTRTRKTLPQRPLFGKRVLVTRSREQADDLSGLLAEAGAVPVEIPLIRIAPPDSWEPVDRSISRLGSYDWVIFTSANGVQSFFGRLGELGKDSRALGGCHIAAIGSATAAELLRLSVRPDLVPAEFVAEALLEGLARSGVGGRRVLLAQAAAARDVLLSGLRALGAEIDAVPLYRTLKVDDAPPRLTLLLEASEIDAVIFASSSAVRRFAEALGNQVARKIAGIIVACIGPVTAETARGLGIRVDVIAEEHTISGLVRGLAQYYADRSQTDLDV